MSRQPPKKKDKHHPAVMCPHCAGHTPTDNGNNENAVIRVERVGGCLQI